MRASEDRAAKEKSFKEARKDSENITAEFEAAEAEAEAAQAPVEERAKQLAQAESALKAAQQRKQYLLSLRSNADELINKTKLSHSIANRTMHRVIQEHSNQLAAVEAAQIEVATEKQLLAAAQRAEAAALQELTATRHRFDLMVGELDLEEKVRLVEIIEQTEAHLEILHDVLTSPLMVGVFTLLGTVAVLNCILDRNEAGVSTEIEERKTKPIDNMKVQDGQISKILVEASKPVSDKGVFSTTHKTLADLIREHHQKANIVASVKGTDESVKPCHEKNMLGLDSSSREEFFEPDSEPEST
jgi:hypothetical protein